MRMPRSAALHMSYTCEARDSSQSWQICAADAALIVQLQRGLCKKRSVGVQTHLALSGLASLCASAVQAYKHAPSRCMVV